MGALQRTVHGVVGEEQEKGFVGVTIDKVDRFASERIGQIGRFVDRLAAAQNRIVGIVVGFVVMQVRAVGDVAEGASAGSSTRKRFTAQPGSGAEPRRRDKIMPLVYEAEKFVEAAALRVVNGGAAAMPFADVSGDITRLAKGVGQRGLGSGESVGRILILGSYRIELMPKTGP
jgi:hypothetical protein